MKETAQVTVQLPARVSQLAGQHQPGQFHLLYRRRLHRFLLWSFPGWIALSVIVLSYNGYMLFLDANTFLINPSIQFLGDTANMLFVLMGLVFGALGVNPFSGFQKRLSMMDDGLLYTNGKKSEVIHWDEIEALFWWKKRGISYLCRKDGSRFSRIEEMEKAQEISTIVAGAVAEHLFPDVLARYQKTGKADFGPLAITQEGIANVSKAASWEPAPVISWADVEDVRFEKGKLGIQVDKKWKYWDEGIMRTSPLPNPTICVALIRHILETVE